MIRMLLVAASLLLGADVAMAVQAMRGVVNRLILRDGSAVEATLVGDENVHYYKTDDGRCIQLVGGAYECVDGDSLRGVWRKRLRERDEARRVKATVPAYGTSYTGSKRGLVILVNFADLVMETGLNDWIKYFNRVGYDEHGMYGSVHDYFYEQSYGKLNLTFDVVGPVSVSEEYCYYGKGDVYNAPLMIKEACQKVNSEVNFADYDWNGDGIVDLVIVVYAGYNEAQGASADTIWPHEWVLSALSSTSGLKLDGVLIDTYACTSELHGNGRTDTGIMDGIGTVCHEFSHCLGLPDLYDTVASNSFGMDVWSVMDYGNYNDGGYTPAAFTAFERYYCGWLELTELKSPTYVRNMSSITDEPCAYVIYNDANNNEFYVLHNIQLTGFNSGAYGHGLLITYVDYDKIVWANNLVNSSRADHQRMTIFAADNSYDKYGITASGDPFPGTSGNTSFTDTTTPASTLYHSNLDDTYYMGRPIENITEADGCISFSFMGADGVDAPLAPWSDDATYDLSGRQVVSPATRGVYLRGGRKFLCQ